MASHAVGGTQVNLGTVKTKMADFARDGIQINFNSVINFADNAISGVQINLGDVDAFSGRVDSGIQINFGNTITMSEHVRSGIQLNYGNADFLADFAQGGFQANLGGIKYDDPSNIGQMATDAEGGYQFNFGNIELCFGLMADEGLQVNMGTVLHDESRKYDPISMGNAMPLIAKLETMLLDYNILKIPKIKPENAIIAIQKYDWTNFEKEVLKLNKEIEDKLI